MNQRLALDAAFHHAFRLNPDRWQIVHLGELIKRVDCGNSPSEARINAEEDQGIASAIFAAANTIAHSIEPMQING